MDLFEECMEALGSNAKVLEKKEAEKIFLKFDENFELTLWSTINWDNIKNKKKISSFEEIFSAIEQNNRDASRKIYVIGSDPTVPIIETKVINALENFDDVEALSPNTWFYCPDENWLLEYHHDGSMTIGFIDSK